jgi:uncharacterized repeat protein (TIGR04076 family)
MSKVKITVVKQFGPKDVLGHDFIRTDGRPIEKCGMTEGLEFIVNDSMDMPDGFCHHAWYGLYKNISILFSGGGFPDWTGENMIYTTCPDGIRPVCFQIERIEE